MDGLLEHAHVMGLRVRFDNLGRRHVEVRSSGLIVVNDHRPPKGMRTILAHEIGHFVHGHDWTTARHEVARDERQAMTYAACLVIAPAQYRDAEYELGTEVRHLARQLDVTEELVLLWRESFGQEHATGRHLLAV